MKRFWSLLFFLGFASLYFGQTKVLKVGDQVPDFTANNLQNEPFTFSSQKGKTVLLDFWASWCAPCIQEQPELVKLYQHYEGMVKAGKFEIVGFSLDNKKENWEKIVTRFQIPWPQVSDLKFWRSPIVKDYGISELPYNLLVDGEGKVLAVNLHGADLETMLKKILEN